MKKYIALLFIVPVILIPVGCTVWIWNIPRNIPILLTRGLGSFNEKNSTKFGVAEDENGNAVLVGTATSAAQREAVREYAMRFLSVNGIKNPKFIDHILVK